jgi:WD40 repeat protein
METDLECFCDLIGFVDRSRFLTLEKGDKSVEVRNASTGELLSELFVFPSEVHQARYFPSINLLLGIGDDRSVIFAKPGGKDNSVNYGDLEQSEVLSTANWLTDDVILIELHKLNEKDWSEVERRTRILERKEPVGYERFWTGRSDQVQEPNDEWSPKVDRFVRGEYVGSARSQWCSHDLQEGVDMHVAGAGNVRGVLSRNDIALVDFNTGKELLRIPITPSNISCLWASQDGKLFAAGSQDGVIRLWDLHLSGTPIANLLATPKKSTY